MNKRLLIIFGVIVVLLVPFVAFLVTQQGSQTAKITVNNNGTSSQSQSETGGSYSGGSAGNGSSPTGSQTISPTDIPNSLTADESALRFYKYYFAAPSNPLANGAYENSIYLSQDFKDVMHDLYKNGDTPVFCAKNQRPNVTVGQDKQVYSDGGYLTQVVISDAGPGAKGLYRIEMQNLTGEWLVYDINCIR